MIERIEYVVTHFHLCDYSSLNLQVWHYIILTDNVVWSSTLTTKWEREPRNRDWEKWWPHWNQLYLCPILSTDSKLKSVSNLIIADVLVGQSASSDVKATPEDAFKRVRVIY